MHQIRRISTRIKQIAQEFDKIIPGETVNPKPFRSKVLYPVDEGIPKFRDVYMTSFYRKEHELLKSKLEEVDENARKYMKDQQNQYKGKVTTLANKIKDLSKEEIIALSMHFEYLNKETINQTKAEILQKAINEAFKIQSPPSRTFFLNRNQRYRYRGGNKFRFKRINRRFPTKKKVNLLKKRTLKLTRGKITHFDHFTNSKINKKNNFKKLTGKKVNSNEKRDPKLNLMLLQRHDISQERKQDMLADAQPIQTNNLHFYSNDPVMSKHFARIAENYTVSKSNAINIIQSLHSPSLEEVKTEQKKRATLAEVAQMLNEIAVDQGVENSINSDNFWESIYEPPTEITRGNVFEKIYKDPKLIFGFNSNNPYIHLFPKEGTEKKSVRSADKIVHDYQLAAYTKLSTSHYFKHQIWNSLSYLEESKLDQNNISVPELPQVSEFRELKNTQSEEEKTRAPQNVDTISFDSGKKIVGRRKAAIALVSIKKGTGKILVNKIPINQYFTHPYYRVRMMKPIQLSGLACQIDIDINIKGGGSKGQAEACIPAISKALVKINPHLKETLKEYLMTDFRRVESKKPGKKKARKGRPYQRR